MLILTCFLIINVLMIIYYYVILYSKDDKIQVLKLLFCLVIYQ